MTHPFLVYDAVDFLGKNLRALDCLVTEQDAQWSKAIDYSLLYGDLSRVSIGWYSIAHHTFLSHILLLLEIAIRVLCSSCCLHSLKFFAPI